VQQPVVEGGRLCAQLLAASWLQQGRPRISLGVQSNAQVEVRVSQTGQSELSELGSVLELACVPGANKLVARLRSPPKMGVLELSFQLSCASFKLRDAGFELMSNLSLSRKGFPSSLRRST